MEVDPMRLRHSRTAVAVVCALVLPALVAEGQTVPPSEYQEMHWRMIGPFRGGRTRALAGVHGDPDTLYIGICNGGIWKTDDYGRTWTPIFDAQPTQSIGAIAVAPSNPNVIYAASGEGLQRPDLSVGDGIYKSTDAGRTWTHLGLRDSEQIPALAVDPRDPDRVFAAVLGHPYGPNQERGIFRSTDGGATWQKVLYLDENTGGNDVDVDPRDPRVVYATLWEARQGPWEDHNAYGGEKGGIYKSTDGGTTWTRLVNGLPEKIVQANLSIAPSDPDRIYVILATTNEGAYDSGKGQGLYRSDDAGASWRPVTDDPRPLMRIGGGDLPMLGVDPTNPDVVYSTSIVTVRSEDGGTTWVSLRGAPGGDDYQNIWIDPADPKIILLASDQGAVVSVNGGATWSSWYTLPTAQLYHVQATNDFPYKVCGGQQESGSVCISTRGNDGAITFRDWHPVGASEYGEVAPDPLDPDVIYGAGRNEVSKYHVTTGQVEEVTPIPVLGTAYRVHRTQPIMFSPVDLHVLYFAANVVFETSDGAASWTQISPDLSRPAPGIPASLGGMAANDPRAARQRGVVYALAPSFTTTRTLWAGTDDGLVWVTRDGGKNWADVTPPGIVPWSKVTQIAASPFDDATAYVSVSGFRIDDLRPHIYRTHDGGATWTRIVAGLPDDAPVDTVREDLARKGLLYAGTETGVWVSFDDGDHWQSLQLDLPHTSMRDLWIHHDDLIVATHGRSFWVLDDLSPLRQASAEIAAGAVHLFKPADASRVRRDLNTDTPLPADEPIGENPPAGAIVDYWLKAPAPGPVTLEILDAKGALVRRYSSTDTPESTPEQLAKQMIPTYWARPFRALPATAGMHRWVWDLRYPPPGSPSRSYPISAVPHDTPTVPQGPLVVPGTYTVRLSADGTTLTRPLVVTMDPRVKTSQADLERQFELERHLAALMTDAENAVRSAHSVREQVATLSKTARGRLSRALSKLDDEVNAVLAGPKKETGGSGPEGLKALQREAGGLYRAVGQADVGPSAALQAASAKVESDLRSALDRWTSAESSVAKLNRRLRSSHLAPIDPARKPSGAAGSPSEE
jgi:photosystem II stability/assembly factor-like uncharacterized protein